ncbi:MAG TPA: aminoglycoside phosphotransferase family protein [Gammaproteobacteria bacterium]|nr:aminoglycoside phosphotransferase family protein [Gammaproteobacteria bacterium]
MTPTSGHDSPPAEVLLAFGLTQPRCERITSGHINQTWRLSPAKRSAPRESFVLQHVNPLFPPEVQHDIVAVTAHLRSLGVRTIELLETRTGEPFYLRHGEIWRLTRFIQGATIDRVEHPWQAREAGRLLGEFHTALRSFPGRLGLTRPGVHDLPAHLQRLEAALAAHRQHRHYVEIERIAARIVEAAAEVRDHPPTEPVLVHGDPKISNVIFDRHAAVCLIDLDTLGVMPVELEIADALRSWCNPEAEDSPQANCSAALFRAACEGYAHIDRELALTLPDVTAQIAVELAARFCADALAESYFGWDASRFETASAHNKARCDAQLALAADILGQRPQLRSMLLELAR